jgi:hypothetical protein
MCVSEVEAYGYLVVTIIKEEEKENTLMPSLAEKEDHLDEFLTQWKKEMKMLED